MKVELSKRADRFLKKLDNHRRQRIEERLKKLSEEPVPHDAKFLGRDNSNEKVYRFRIGDFRALYKVKTDIVLIAKIDKRPRVYSRR